MGDLSRLPVPLSWRDLIFLDEFTAAKAERTRKERLVFEDIRFYLAHSGFLSINAAEAVRLPSYVAYLEQRLSERGE